MRGESRQRKQEDGRAGYSEETQELSICEPRAFQMPKRYNVSRFTVKNDQMLSVGWRGSPVGKVLAVQS